MPEEPPPTNAGPDAIPEGRGAFDELRALALGAVAAGLARPPWEHPDVAGVVVDVPVGDGLATLVALGDGTTSLYLSNGGASVGVGALPPVAAAAVDLLVAVQLAFEASEPDGLGEPGTGSPPPAETVRVHLLSPDGHLHQRDVPSSQFFGPPPPDLADVVARTHALLIAIDASGL